MLTGITGQRSHRHEYAVPATEHKAIQEVEVLLIDSDRVSMYHLCGVKKSKSALSFRACGRWTLNWQNRSMNPSRPKPFLCPVDRLHCAASQVQTYGQ